MSILSHGQARLLIALDQQLVAQAWGQPLMLSSS